MLTVLNVRKLRIIIDSAHSQKPETMSYNAYCQKTGDNY